MVRIESKIVKKKHNSQEIINSLSYLNIPTEIFRLYPLAVLESIVIFLKNEKNLNFSEIGILLSRDQRNIWTVYNRANKKLASAQLQPVEPNTKLSILEYIQIPTEIFRFYSLAVLESIVVYLKDERYLSFSDIAMLLGRDQRNIWTVYSRARAKLDKM